MGCGKPKHIKETIRIASSELGKKGGDKGENPGGDKGENPGGDKGENFASQVKDVEDNNQQEVNSDKQSIKIPADERSVRDKDSVAPHKDDEEKPSKISGEVVKIGTEEERLEIIEYFLQLGYEIPLILDCEEACGSDKEGIMNCIETRLRH